jgi:hypothetical protein
MPLIGRLRISPLTPPETMTVRQKNNRHDVALAGWKERQISGFSTINPGCDVNHIPGFPAEQCMGKVGRSHRADARPARTAAEGLSTRRIAPLSLKVCA